MKHLDYEVLYDKIHIYRGMIPDVEKFVELLVKSEADPSSSYVFSDWQPWSIFGTYIYQNSKDLPYDIADTAGPVYFEEKHFIDLVYKAFYETTDHYLKSYGKEKGADWQLMGPSIARYDYKTDDELKRNPYAMLHHTDYKKVEADQPGPKFALTCTMYLNDDYDGGGLKFLVDNEKEIYYKPKAGEVVVFPSGHPDFMSEEGEYLHGVEGVSGKDKYFIRCFYQIPFEGTQEWWDNLNKYGEERWSLMEQARIKANKRYHDEITLSVGE